MANNNEQLIRTASPKATRKAIVAAFRSQRPIFLWGPPGIGKSDIVHQIGEGMEAPVIDVRLSLWEPTDIKGIPYFNSVTSTMQWAPPQELPSKEWAAQYPNVILFLDEMNSAAPSVQAAAYQLILNRRVGAYELPENVLIVAAGNREADKGVTYRMPSPLANRFTHIEMEVDFDDWLEWAIEKRIHKHVVAYLNFVKKDLYDFDPKSSSRAFATPRSWSFVSNFLHDEAIDDNTLSDLISGTIGDGLQIKFKNFIKMAGKLPQPLEILNGNVTKLDSSEISGLYALAVGLVYELNETKDKVDYATWCTYVDNYFKFMISDAFGVPELTILSIRLALKEYNLKFNPGDIDSWGDFMKWAGPWITESAKVK